MEERTVSARVIRRHRRKYFRGPFCSLTFALLVIPLVAVVACHADIEIVRSRHERIAIDALGAVVSAESLYRVTPVGQTAYTSDAAQLVSVFPSLASVLRKASAAGYTVEVVGATASSWVAAATRRRGNHSLTVDNTGVVTRHN